MDKKNILLIGSGRRAQTVILPALYCLKDEFKLVSIYSRSIKEISLFNNSWRLKTINDLNGVNFHQIDIIMIAVSIEAVPDVLKKLSAFNLNHVRLMIDTPVLPHFRLGAAKYFKNFRDVTVSEDNIALPQYRLVRELINQGKIGNPRHVYMWHSGFKFHALAGIKKIFNINYVSRIKNNNLGNGFREKIIKIRNGVTIHVFEPRLYSVGRFLVIGSHGSIADYQLATGKNSFCIAYNQDSGIYKNLALNDLPLSGDKLDRLYSDNVPTDLSDSSINTALKIRGLMSLIADEEDKSFKYSPIDGIYDMMAIKISDKLGFFLDFPIGKNNSFFKLILSFIINLSKV